MAESLARIPHDNITRIEMSHTATTRTHQSPHPAQVPYACITAVSGTFNSLSKVLCTFPSRYLFAIGLELVLSLRWNVPPNLRSRPREHDSECTVTYAATVRCQTGFSPSIMPVAKGLTPAKMLVTCLHTTTHKAEGPCFSIWALPCSFAITKGILFSFNSSAHLYA